MKTGMLQQDKPLLCSHEHNKGLSSAEILIRTNYMKTFFY